MAGREGQMTRIPESVKVGAHTYRVERHCARDMVDESGQPLMGDLDDNELRIRLRKGMRRSKCQDIALHETLHACFDGVSYEWEEAAVTLLTPRLLQVLQDNPLLVEFLISK